VTVPRRHLLVIGSNPPTTDGQRTLARCEMARLALQFDEVDIENLFALPTYRTGGIAEVGRDERGWRLGRQRLLSALRDADGVVLAYGVSAPSGTARARFNSQVEWLNVQLSVAALPSWWVGGSPRHPSRWHRYTARTMPDALFADALTKVLVPRA
jgi:hypothetical protein